MARLKHNIFCDLNQLITEADVEAQFVDRLIAKLRYPDANVKRKHSLDKMDIAKGSSKEKYRPDYVLYDRNRRPSVVIDAKAPSEKPERYLYQVAGYALGINQAFDNEDPVRYVIVSNGRALVLWAWNNSTPILSLSFDDFEEDNVRFVQLRSLLSFGAVDLVRATENVFRFERPDLGELVALFNECHNTIWKKEKLGPTDAFYEFAKLIFVKLREDDRIAKMVVAGQKPLEEDFNFSVAWIKEQSKRNVSENPIADILFTKIRDELEEQIKRGEKKRILASAERLNLKADTVLEIVERLQHLDLHGIDEDLNGRMFETFLNATVRGKELGQFFTPRSVVKYMTRCTVLNEFQPNGIRVLDGCCGSGGFLIEAMAEQVHAIDRNGSLTDKQKADKRESLYREQLYGVDASPTITRVARLNMYLHGDGGSTIYSADTLDKTLEPPKGVSAEERRDAEEIQKRILVDKIKFNVILTNPPFSMGYSSKDEAERRILEQYDIATTDGVVSQNEKSNVLFLERYCDLLESDGELLTVIDNTVLNGKDSQVYRDFILKHFILKQVVSLPFNTFFRAQANIQTSILHLKRREEGESQGSVFMAILNNVGHDDSQGYTPERDNMPLLSAYFREWKKAGKIRAVTIQNESKEENLGCPFQVFIVPSETLNPKRLDAFYYAPELTHTRRVLKKRSDLGILQLVDGSAYELIKPMKRLEVDGASGTMFKYFDIGDVSREGAILNYIEDLFENLPTRGRLRIMTNDVLIAKNNSSRGTTVIVPPEFNGQLATTGFIGIRPSSQEEAFLLWSILTSETIRKQVYYLAITASQPEIREEIFRNDFVLPIPKKARDRSSLIELAKKVYEVQRTALIARDKARSETRRIFEGE